MHRLPRRTALGNGPSFIDQDIFNKVVFGGDPSAKPIGSSKKPSASPRKRGQRTGDVEAGTKAADKMLELWTKGSLDEWGNPLRPANLNRGVYKGGRRPIDIYWRISKGINGAKMPAHNTASTRRRSGIS